MSVSELIPSLRELSKDDKVQLLHFLIEELAREEPSPLKAGEAYPIWSPYYADDAARTLVATLAAENDQDG